MHELALCDAMLKMVRDISREQALEGVRSITVRVGTLSGVVPRFLTDCWTAVTDGTGMTACLCASRRRRAAPAVSTAGRSSSPTSRISPARTAAGKKLMPLSGRDMTIQEIEAY